MAALPWRSFGRPDPDREYVVLLSCLPLKRGWQIPGFILKTVRVMRQLGHSRGFIGYALRADLPGKRFFTLSAWEDERALQRFAVEEPNGRIVKSLRPHTGETRFVRRMLKGSEQPPSW